MPAKREDATSRTDSETYDVAVVGGGIVGLAVAWRAGERGLSVLLLERGELGAGTSRVAAGMLAPVAETDAGERPLLELGLRSARRWPRVRRSSSPWPAASTSATARAARWWSPAIATRPRRSSASATCASASG